MLGKKLAPLRYPTKMTQRLNNKTVTIVE